MKNNLNKQIHSFKYMGELEDVYLGSPYVLGYANAKEVRDYLLGNLKSKKIDPKSHNRGRSDNLEKNPPLEIYEYQSFFLLERNDGELILLDGFRRLLWYNSPEHQIQVRVYKASDLSNQQIMKILIYLNHFKFYGGSGEYYDRGFSLALNLIFGLNIPKYYEVFDAYLTLSNTKRSYYDPTPTSDSTNTSVKDRMLNPMFIDDMMFIEGLLSTNTMLNDIFGALLYKYRKQYPDKPFDLNMFIDRCKSNKLIVNLEERIKTKGDGSNAEGQKNVNQLVPLYENIFNEMFGAETQLTYAEKMEECKKILADLKKDKTLTKLTGLKMCHWVEKAMVNRINAQQPLTFKCLIYPNEEKSTDFGFADKKPLKHGLVEYPIKFLRQVKKSLGRIEEVYGFTTEDGTNFELRHNYSSYGYSTKYTRVESTHGLPTKRYKCDVFVDIPKAEYEKLEKERFKNL